MLSSRETTEHFKPKDVRFSGVKHLNLVQDSPHTHLEELVHPQPVDARPLPFECLQEALQVQKLCREQLTINTIIIRKSTGSSHTS